MGKGFFKVPKTANKPVKSYAPGSPECEAMLKAYKGSWNTCVDAPLYTGSEEIRTGNTSEMHPPHDHKHCLGVYHNASKAEVEKAITVALEARKKWAALAWEERAAIFLKAADLIARPCRAKMSAAIMITQSKTVHQTEIDSACELIDFLRFNVEFMANICNDQPNSSEGVWNRVEYRPLEGFVYAIIPFSFTAISGNLPVSAALMGNVVIWKPSASQVFSVNMIVEVFKKADLLDGVINVLHSDAAMIADALLASPHFAGTHFTGSTNVLQDIWKKTGNNIHNYRTYLKIAGETGGKDFILAHPSACAEQVATAIARGAFEYQRQKCSVASRVYLPKSKAEETLELVRKDVLSFKMGSPENLENFITAVTHENSFDKLAKYIDGTKKDKDVETFVGGGYDKSKGYFIEPTAVVTTNPHYTTMETELFGPMVTVYVYEDVKWEEMLKLVDETSAYVLTGAIFATCRYAIDETVKTLENAAGNFYVNDKPTGAVVGQQPFGSARASGTNSKTGLAQNLLRWVSPRLIKETFAPPVDYRYPFLG